MMTVTEMTQDAMFIQLEYLLTRHKKLKETNSRHLVHSEIKL